MRDLLIAIGVVAVIIAAHAIPELIINLVPTWILIPAAIVLFVALVRAVIWTASQAWEADR